MYLIRQDIKIADSRLNRMETTPTIALLRRWMCQGLLKRGNKPGSYGACSVRFKSIPAYLPWLPGTG
jgi:hypothetical protein